MIIPPVVAILMATCFIAHYKPGSTGFVIVTGILQAIYVVMMLYFHEKIKWKEVFTNLQQERWMQVNNFVLNNIPENIFILELGGGQVMFVSDYCKAFLQKLHLSNDPKELFGSIKDLYRQPEENDRDGGVSHPLNVAIYLSFCFIYF